MNFLNKFKLEKLRESRLRTTRTSQKHQLQHPLHITTSLTSTTITTEDGLKDHDQDANNDNKEISVHQSPTFCQRSLNIFSTTIPSRTSPATNFTTTLHSSCTTKRIFLATPMAKFQSAWTNRRWRRGTGQYPKSTTRNWASDLSLHPIFQSGSNELVAAVSSDWPPSYRCSIRLEPE